MYRTVAESQTLLINTQSQHLLAENKQVIRFGFGQSPFLPPSRVLQALAQASPHKEYSSVQGDLELRTLLSQFHRNHNGLASSPDDILIAPGSKVLLYTILLAHQTADVLIPQPAWVSYAPQAQLAGHRQIPVATSFRERWRVHPENLEQALQQRTQTAQAILILNYPGNPDGLTYTATELAALAEVCRKHQILVISDEIYGLLDHSGYHHSMATFYPEGTITTTGLSKWCGAGGWRLGAAILPSTIPVAFRKALLGIGSETYSCAPMPVQVAAREAYRSYEATRGYLDWQVEILKKIGQYCFQHLSAAGIDVHPPEGGFYLFPDFSPLRKKLQAARIKTGADLCQRILAETGVALLPASAFGFAEEHLAARLAYVDFPNPATDQPFHVERDAPLVVRGIELLCAWLDNL